METATPSKPINRTRGLVLLWVAMLVFAAANSVIAKLGLLGAHNLVHGRNPISFCNVLFTANLIASFTLLMIHRRDWRKQVVRQLSVRDWGYMTLLSVVSGVLAPSLFFFGLMLTTVINVVLISSIEIPLTLLFGWWIMKERPAMGTVIGATLALLGVALTFALHKAPPKSIETKMTMVQLGSGALARFFVAIPKAGELCVAVGALLTVWSVEFGRKVIACVPVGIYSVFRMVATASIVFCLLPSFLGWAHFLDIFSPFLWKWMLIYGGIILAGGLYSWHRGLSLTKPADWAITNSFTPAAGVFFAFLILQEVPEQGQIIGGAFVVLGVAIAMFVKLRVERERKQRPHHPPRPKSFTGV